MFLRVRRGCQGLLQQISANILSSDGAHAGLSFSWKIEGQSEWLLQKSGNLHTGCLLNGDSDKKTYGTVYRSEPYKETLSFDLTVRVSQTSGQSSLVRQVKISRVPKH